MEYRVAPIHQLMQLFLDNDIELNEDTDENVKEVVKIHNEYLEDERAQIAALELERDRMTYYSRLGHAKREGEKIGEKIGVKKGEKKGKIEGKIQKQQDNVLKMFQKVYPNEDTRFLEGLTLEQYDTLHDMIFEREPIAKMKKYLGID